MHNIACSNMNGHGSIDFYLKLILALYHFVFIIADYQHKEYLPSYLIHAFDNIILSYNVQFAYIT